PAAATSPAMPPGRLARDVVVPGRVIVLPAVTMKTDAEGAAVVGALATATRLPLVFVKRAVLGYLVVDVGRIDASGTAAVARILAEQRGVLAAEPDVVLYASRTANDELYPELWGFAAIDVESAW